MANVAPQSTDSWWEINWGAIILLLAVIAAIVWFFLRRPGLFVFRGPRKRHVITRIICGSLGLGILIALTVGTLHAVNKTYDPSAFPAVTAYVPTLPPPTPAATKGADESPLKSVRLLIQLVLLDTDSGNQVVHLAEMQTRWTEGQTTHDKTRLTVGKRDLELTAEVSRLYADAKAKDSVEVFAGLTLVVTTDHGHMSGGNWGRLETGLNDLYEIRSDNDNSKVNMNLISLLPARGDDLQAVAIITLLADNDPLKEVSGQELMAMHKDELTRIRTHTPLFDPSEPRNSMPALGLAGVAHIGLATISLLAATILLTQLFTRRTLAFAGVMAVVILYAAAMDRAVLSMNVSHLNDQAAPLAVRAAACRQTAMSFFYGKTALREIQAVASDASAPPALQRCAKQTVQTMKELTQSGDGGRS